MKQTCEVEFQRVEQLRYKLRKTLTLTAQGSGLLVEHEQLVVSEHMLYQTYWLEDLHLLSAGAFSIALVVEVLCSRSDSSTWTRHA